MNANDIAHKERQRKRDSRMIRQMYEDPSNRPPIPHAVSNEEESEPEGFDILWERFQQVDLVTQNDYWDRAIRNSYYNPIYAGMQSGGASYSEMPFMSTQGQSTSSSMPPVDPYASGGSGPAIVDPLGGFFGLVNPYVGMFVPPSPPSGDPSQTQGHDDEDEE